MISRLALRPDLNECLLEDRTLLAYPPGLQASQFIPTSGITPSFVVSGFSTGSTGPGSGGSTYPGPQFFYLTIGLFTSSNSGSGGGIRLGGTANVYNPGNLLPTLQGATVGSIPGAGGTGGISNTAGYGGSISSGYNTALSSTNNFGMGTTALGSVAPHISGTTDQLVEAQAADTNTPQTATAANQDTNAPSSPPLNAGQGPFMNQDRLLGKGLGSPNGLLIGPGTNLGPAMTTPNNLYSAPARP